MFQLALRQSQEEKWVYSASLAEQWTKREKAPRSANKHIEHKTKRNSEKPFSHKVQTQVETLAKFPGTTQQILQRVFNLISISDRILDSLVNE